MFQLLRLAELFIVHGMGWVVMLKMYFLLTLLFLPYSIPIAFLVAVLMAVGIVLLFWPVLTKGVRRLLPAGRPHDLLAD